jgi:YVTN family beta-propeller protein
MHANELVVIDPATATVTASVFVGSDPTSLAISEDGSTLWVSLEGSREIRTVALGDGAPVPGESYDLPATDFDAPVAGPMVVLPGTTDSVAVSMHVWGLSPSFMGLVVLDEGVPRPVQTPGHTGAARLTSGPAGWLYGFNDLHTGFGFYAIEVQDSGPVATEYEGFVEGFGTDIVYADGFVFATDGAVIDVSEPAAPDLAGTFPFAGAVIPEVAANRVIMLSPPAFGEASATIRELDLATFTQIGAAGIAFVGDIVVVDFVRADDTTLAMLVGDYFADARQLLLVEHPFP